MFTALAGYAAAGVVVLAFLAGCFGVGCLAVDLVGIVGGRGDDDE